jgi:hypothetical protein
MSIKLNFFWTKLVVSKEIQLCDLDDIGLIDNRVRMFKDPKCYRVISENKVFGLFPLTKEGYKAGRECLEATLALKQAEFDQIYLGDQQKLL